MLKKQIPKVAFSIAEVCESLSLGRTTVFGLVKSGDLSVVRVGRRTLVPAEALQQFVQRAAGSNS